MVRKFRGIAEAAAVVEMAAQVGLRTRARAALATAAASTVTASKRRKVDNASSSSEFSPSPPNVELRSQRCVEIAQDKESVVLRAEMKNRCTSHPSAGELSASCCSSNGSSERAKEAAEFVDLEEEGGDVETSTYYCSRARRETMPSNQDRTESGMLESPAAKMPTESELEEFFAGPEKEIQKRFAEKYNYDIAKDEPMEEGRYEWIR